MQRFIGIVIVIALLGAAGFLGWRWYTANSDSNVYIGQWLRNPQAHAELTTAPFTRCGDAPFIIPTEGFIGLLWRDSARPYSVLNRHTGIDIFGGGRPGTHPIVAVYDGYLTRLEDWTSTLIIRHDDPLQAGRTIWTYYTHMADTNGNSYIVEDFPRGTYNKPIEQGTLIGYQGNYSPTFPVAVHLHMSIVTSDADGSFLNEALLQNTVNPSAYFGMDLNSDTQAARPVRCRETS